MHQIRAVFARPLSCDESLSKNHYRSESNIAVEIREAENKLSLTSRPGR